MKIIFTLLANIVAVAAIFAASPEKAIMIVHYGTTNDHMRERALNTINNDVIAAYPDFEFIEAYTSPMVIKSLAKRGIDYLTPLEALMKLRSKGVKEVTVQSTMLMNGSQTEVITLDAERMRPYFDTLKVGQPLLNTIEDSRFLLNLLKNKYPITNKNEAIVFVGHGGNNAGTAIYSQLAEMLDESPENYYVSTIEGYPDIDNLLSRLKKDKVKNVTLVPLLIVGGNHIYQDIDGQWKQQLQNAGYKVTVRTEALGEDPDFRKWFLTHIPN